MNIALPVLIAVVGLFIYLASASGKASEVGRILFFVGSFVATFVAGVRVIHLP